jgi:serine/threonine-protein kinase
MADDARIEQLLDELFDSNATPELVCAQCPELLAEVRIRWQQVQRLQGLFDGLLPPAEKTHSYPPPDAATTPQIPGYQIEAVLGCGGVGVVYKAWQLRVNRPVALKMLLAGAYAREDERERFLGEARAVAALCHPNIVQLYDAGEVDGRPYFTMELVEGGCLATKIAGAPQPAAWAASLVATLAGAVHYAHQSGFIHRDLKPGNVLLTADGTPKVTDFGLARRLEDKDGLTLSGVLIGTPSYMAPEQARGDKGAIGPATDVYALGAILYELLTGRPPFRGETATATLQQVTDDEPVPPGRLNPAVRRDLQTICLKCLHKEPQRRYASAQALADDLHRFEKGEPITARPAGPLERAAKWVRRRPTAAALLAAALLMLVGVTAAAVWYAGDRAQRARQVNREANAALRDAETHLKDLRAKVDDPVQVQELLSDIDRWQSMVEQARQDLERAKSASAGNEALLAEDTRAHFEAVEAAVDREQAAYDLAKELDDIAVESLTSFDARQSKQRKAMAQFERLFEQRDLDIHQPGTARFTSAITSSPVRFALIAALDNWAWLAARIEDPQVARLLELARAADPEPWRDRFRNPKVWADSKALTGLADDVDVERQPPTVLASLGWLLLMNGEDATALFERALLGHPRDFWLHLHASQWGMDSSARIGLAHATLAIRPGTPLVYNTLAWHLRKRGDLAAALVAANRAIKINPKFSWAYVNRGLILADQNNLPEAIAAYKEAIDLQPDDPWAFWNLGNALRIQGDGAATAAAYREAAELDLTVLRGFKDKPRKIAGYQRAIDLDPKDFRARLNLGQLLQLVACYAEAEQAYLGAFQAQPACVPACDALARLLASCPDEKVRDGKRAVEYATTACERTAWKDPRCLDTLAAAYAEAGRFEDAVRYQNRALADPALKDDFRAAARERLELYRQKKPFRDQGS